MSSRRSFASEVVEHDVAGDTPNLAARLQTLPESDDPEQEYFADGMVEETVTALSRIRWLFDPNHLQR